MFAQSNGPEAILGAVTESAYEGTVQDSGPQEAVWSFDRREAEEYLDEIYGGQSARVFLAFRDQGGRVNDREFFCLPEQRDELLVRAKKHVVKGRDVWLTPGSVREGQREAKNMAPGRVIWVDLDRKLASSPEKFEEGLDLLEKADAFIVNTGGGVHAYLRLDRSASPDEIKRMNKLLVEQYRPYGADSGSVDSSRLLRLPGTWNFKEEYDSPRPVTIHQTFMGPYLDPDKLLAEAPELPDVTAAVEELEFEQIAWEDLRPKLQGMLNRAKRQGTLKKDWNRSDYFYSLCGVAGVECGLSMDQTAYALREYGDGGDGGKYEGRWEREFVRAWYRAQASWVPDRPQEGAEELPTVAEFVEELKGIREPEDRNRRAIELAQKLGRARADEATVAAFRAEIPKLTSIGKRDFNRAVKAGARRLVPVPDADQLYPPPDDPMAVGRHVLSQEEAPDRVAHLSWWRGDFYRWTGAHWRREEPAAVQGWLYRLLEKAVYEAEGEGGVPDYKPWKPNSRRVADVADALAKGIVQRPAREEPVDGARGQGIACANGVVDIATGELIEHHPRRFNLTSLPFDYDPLATAPEWEKFLESTLPADAREFLQEWFGYVVSGRTDLQKIANLVGPPRSGKGTIAEILSALVGPEATAETTLEKLASPFGKQALIGKSLAIMGDVQWNLRRENLSVAVAALKGISGEDAQDVERKHLTNWHGKLGVRFMIMGNEPPKYSDASGALSGRLIHVEFTKSFQGREDIGLRDRLLKELPGIMNWAMKGLRRLTERGRFVQPQSGEGLAEEATRQQSPIQGFLDDCCHTTDDPEARVLVADLRKAFNQYADREGISRIEATNNFSRWLKATGWRMERVRVGGRQQMCVFGLKPAYEGAWGSQLTLGGKPLG
jgi:putative DNA primase/helicase